MKALVWHGEGDIRLDNVADPTIQDPNDAIVRITRSAICGTDLHFLRGTMAGMHEGTILGHEAVGVIEEVGAAVRGLSRGDRVIVCSTMSCGVCRYCRMGQTAQCDVANPNGPAAGTCFFDGPAPTGPVDRLQAEYARIPWAANTLVPIPANVSDDEAILLSDIFPTAWFGAQLAGIRRGDTVAVYGAGIVGQLAIAAAYRQGAGRVWAIDGVQTRLVKALEQNAEVIDFNVEDPVEAIMEATMGVGVDAVIEAVGVDAQRPSRGPAAEKYAAVTTALRMGLWRRDRAGHTVQDGLVHHSDAGSQFTSVAFAETLALEGIAASIGSIGDAYDNALAESTIGLFKNEAVRDGSPFRTGPLRTIDDLEWATAGWVDWYNDRRLHSTLGNIPPKEFEAAYYAGLTTPSHTVLAPA